MTISFFVPMWLIGLGSLILGFAVLFVLGIGLGALIFYYGDL